MAIEKLTNTPTNIESLQKLNEVIDYSNLNVNYLYVGDEENIDDSLIHDNLIVVDPDDLLEDPYLMTQMVGSTDTEIGRAGTVPAPEAGSNNRFLAADATWKEIDIPDAASPNLSDYTNDAGFITASDIPTTVSSFTNDANYVTTTQLALKADINNPTFTGTVTVPKIVTTTGIEIY